MHLIQVPSIDSEVHTPVVPPTASNVPLVPQSQVPTIPRNKKTVEIPQAQFFDEVVDVPVVLR